MHFSIRPTFVHHRETAYYRKTAYDELITGLGRERGRSSGREEGKVSRYGERKRRGGRVERGRVEEEGE